MPEWHSRYLSCHILQAGYTIKAFNQDWENSEWDQDDHFEELWEKGEAGLEWDATPRVLEPDHFVGIFMITGFLLSIWLIVLLVDILTNEQFGFFKIMLAGLFGCLLVTSANLFFFSTSLLTPITVDEGKGEVFKGEYEFDMEILVKHKPVVDVILGYGAVLSFIFIFVAMMRSLGKTHFLLIINI